MIERWPHLFSAAEFQGIRLKNRVVVGPMTRTSATDDGLATPIMADYYEHAPATREKYAAFGIGMTPSSPQELGERVRTEAPYWAKLMNEAGVKPE